MVHYNFLIFVIQVDCDQLILLKIST